MISISRITRILNPASPITAITGTRIGSQSCFFIGQRGIGSGVRITSIITTTRPFLQPGIPSAVLRAIRFAVAIIIIIAPRRGVLCPPSPLVGRAVVVVVVVLGVVRVGFGHVGLLYELHAKLANFLQVPALCNIECEAVLEDGCVAFAQGNYVTWLNKSAFSYKFIYLFRLNCIILKKR